MVNDHTDSERGNPLPPHGLLFLIKSKGSFIPDRIAHTMAFVTLVVDGKKEGNVLFNNPHLFMGLYAIRHTVKDHSD